VWGLGEEFEWSEEGPCYFGQEKVFEGVLTAGFS